MKARFKAIALAAVLAVTGGANAAVVTGSGIDNGELFFVAYDPTNLLTYSFDLGIGFQSFAPNSASNTFSLAGFSTFLDQVGSANLAGVRWGVFAVDGASPTGLLTTQAGTGGSNPAASRVANITSGISSFFAIHNAQGTHATTANGWTIHTTASGASGTDLGYGGRLLGGGNNFNTNTSFVVTGALSSSLSFQRFTSPTALGSTRTTFAGVAGPSSFRVNGTNLVFTAPVPEPSTYALMLAGLGTLGFMARRRRQSR